MCDELIVVERHRVAFPKQSATGLLLLLSGRVFSMRMRITQLALTSRTLQVLIQIYGDHWLVDIEECRWLLFVFIDADWRPRIIQIGRIVCPWWQCLTVPQDAGVRVERSDAGLDR